MPRILLLVSLALLFGNESDAQVATATLTHFRHVSPTGESRIALMCDLSIPQCIVFKQALIQRGDGQCGAINREWEAATYRRIGPSLWRSPPMRDAVVAHSTFTIMAGANGEPVGLTETWASPPHGAFPGGSIDYRYSRVYDVDLRELPFDSSRCDRLTF